MAMFVILAAGVTKHKECNILHELCFLNETFQEGLLLFFILQLLKIIRKLLHGNFCSAPCPLVDLCIEYKFRFSSITKGPDTVVTSTSP